MMNIKLLAPIVGSLLACLTAAKEYCETTTTIPWVGPTWSVTTMPECSGTVTVVSQSPLCKCTPPPPTTTLATHTTTKTKTKSKTTTIGTPTGTPLIQPCPNVNPLCTDAGYNVEYFANPFLGYSSGSIQSNYYIVDHLEPLSSSLTNITYYPQSAFDTNAPIYPNASDPSAPYFPGATRMTNGGIVVDANNFTMVYQGLFRAPSSGAFTLCTSADNQNDLYFGDNNAYNCRTGQPSTAADPILSTTGASDVNQVKCATFTLVEGLFYPIRSVAGNYQGPSAFTLTYAGPGVAAASGSDDWTGYAYPQSCLINLSL